MNKESFDEQENTPSIQWFDEFSQYLIVERGYSEKTQAAYAEDFFQFLDFLEQSGSRDFLAIDYRDVRIYLSFLNDQKYSRNSISRKVASLRSFYQYLLKRMVLTENPFAYVHLKKKNQKLPRFFYEDELQQLFDSVKGTEPLEQRNLALIEILYGCGLRVSECAAITLTSIDWEHQILLVYGKGSKERIVPFNEHANKAMSHYIQNGRKELLTQFKKEHDYLFVNHLGSPVTATGIEYILNQLLKRSQLDSEIHPHKLRHTFATHLLNNGADMRTVQELLGHANLSTTQIYAHVTKESLQKNYRKFHPRA
ncbi:MAG: tyrosine recombinase XerC [Enterococcus italicus]